MGFNIRYDDGNMRSGRCSINLAEVSGRTERGREHQEGVDTYVLCCMSYMMLLFLHGYFKCAKRVS